MQPACSSCMRVICATQRPKLHKSIRLVKTLHECSHAWGDAYRPGRRGCSCGQRRLHDEKTTSRPSLRPEMQSCSGPSKRLCNVNSGWARSAGDKKPVWKRCKSARSTFKDVVPLSNLEHTVCVIGSSSSVLICCIRYKQKSASMSTSRVDDLCPDEARGMRKRSITLPTNSS